MIPMLIAKLPPVLLQPTMRPLLVVLGCPVVCLILCAAIDGLIAVIERVDQRRRRLDRIVELKPRGLPARSSAATIARR